MKDWESKLESTKLQKDEFYRIINTMEIDDIIDLLISVTTDKYKLNFIKEWNE